MLNLFDSRELRPGGLGALQGKNDKEAIRTVAKEMEALFAYELIKVMRQTTEESASGAFGNGTYLSMFDMELSKLFAERGLGLREMLERGLTSVAEKTGQPARDDGGGRITLPAEEDIRLLLPDLPAARISSGYGPRKDPFTGGEAFHRGIDIAAPEGAGVRSAGRGTVIFSGEQQGYGNVVVIDHGDGLTTKYAHNRENLVKEGEKIDSGALIARAGSTGRATGSHLHFEAVYQGRAINPGRVLAKG